MTKYWTGIGSRKTPPIIGEIMTQFARTKKETLRSGGAKGADQFFARGATNADIYLPWQGFMDQQGIYKYTEYQIAFAEYVAQKVYPVEIRNPTHMKLFRRNMFQIMGLATCVEDAIPSKFVLCWTPDGCIDTNSYQFGVTGGTGVAIMAAREFDIPVFNMQRREHMKMVLEHLEDAGLKTVKMYKQRLMDLGLYR